MSQTQGYQTFEGEGGDQFLREQAQPELYRLNPFRVLGVSIYASEREIKKQGELLKMMIKRGGGGGGNGSSRTKGPLPLDAVPDEHAVRDATQRLLNLEHRIVDELFWLWPQSPEQAKTDEALNALFSNDHNAATALWAAQIRKPDNEGVAVHNLAILNHALALDLECNAGGAGKAAEGKDYYWQKAFHYWHLLLETEEFWGRFNSRLRELNDPRLTPGVGRRLRLALPEALLSINARLAAQATEEGRKSEADRHFVLMRQSGFASEALEDSAKQAVEPICAQIEKLCREAYAQAEANPPQADTATKNLLRDVKPLLETVDSLLPAGNSARDTAHDAAATNILDCAIKFGNETDRWTEARPLIEPAEAIAASESVRFRVRENLQIFRLLVVEAQLWSIYNSEAKLQAKFDKIKKEVAPAFRNLKESWNNEFGPQRLDKLADDLASALRLIAVDLHNEHKQSELAYKVLKLAAEFVVGEEGRLKIESDTQVIYAVKIVNKIKSLYPKSRADALLNAPKIEQILRDADRMMPQWDTSRDEIALGLLISLIDFTEKNNDWSFTQKILNLALPFAVSSDARSRLLENMETIRRNLIYNPVPTYGSTSSYPSSSSSSYGSYGSTATAPQSSTVQGLGLGGTSTYNPPASSGSSSPSTTTPYGGTYYGTASGLSTATLILGIVSLFVCSFGGIVPIIMGGIELKNISNNQSPVAGRERAKAGLILGIISLLISIYFFTRRF
ncbi:MAG TPA: DUF4190 domain-containing protein [Pyrinomonadaceae bacterium]|jgi:hypothetical protein